MNKNSVLVMCILWASIQGCSLDSLPYDCPDGQVVCNTSTGECVDLQSNDEHCEKCEINCLENDSVCVKGICRKVESDTKYYKSQGIEDGDPVLMKYTGNKKFICYCTLGENGSLTECTSEKDGEKVPWSFNYDSKAYCGLASCDAFNRKDYLSCHGDSSCSVSEDVTDGASIVTGKSCKCDNGAFYYVDPVYSNDSKCINPNDPNHCGATQDNPMGENCNEKRDLADNDDSGGRYECYNQSCQCKRQYVTCIDDNGNERCIDSYMNNKYCGIIIHDEQNDLCSNLEFATCDEKDYSTCKQGYCVCNNGYARCADSGTCGDTNSNDEHCGAKGMCNSYVNDDNFAGVDCRKISAKCIDGKCICDNNNGIYMIRELNDGKCHDISSDDEACGTVDENGNVSFNNCKLKGAVCKNGKCECNSSKNMILSPHDNKCHNKLNDATCCGDTCRNCETDGKPSRCINGKCDAITCKDRQLEECGEFCVSTDASHSLESNSGICQCKTNEKKAEQMTEKMPSSAPVVGQSIYCDDDGDLSNGCSGIINTPEHCSSCDDNCLARGYDICKPEKADLNMFTDKWSCSCGEGKLECSVALKDAQGNIVLKEDGSVERDQNRVQCISKMELNALHLADCDNCLPGYKDVDHNMTNGCELKESCGGGTNNCSQIVIHTISPFCNGLNICDYEPKCSEDNPECVAELKGCETGYANCDNDRSNGCETELGIAKYNQNIDQNNDNDNNLTGEEVLRCRDCNEICSKSQNCTEDGCRFRDGYICTQDKGLGAFLGTGSKEQCDNSIKCETGSLLYKCEDSLSIFIFKNEYYTCSVGQPTKKPKCTDWEVVDQSGQ